MSFQEITCVIAVCDVCGDLMPDSDGGSPHFVSEAVARESAPDFGWVVAADGRLVCGMPDAAHDALTGVAVRPRLALVGGR